MGFRDRVNVFEGETPGSASVNATAAPVFGAKVGRTFLQLQNHGPDTVYLAWGVTALDLKGIRLKLNERYTMDRQACCFQALSAVCEVGDTAILSFQGGTETEQGV